MSNARGESAGGVQSVDRAVSVLEILAQRGEAGVSEVAADIGVHKSTAFRLLAALEERELVEQTQERGKYRLGFGILRLASAVPGQLDVTQQARPVCEQLAAQLGETVNIAVRRSHFVVNIDQARGPSAVATHNWVGELTPLHATSSGKILLAFMTPEERREVLASSGLARLTRAHDHVATGTRGAGRGRRARRIRLLRRGTGGRAQRRRRAGPRPHRRRDRGAVACRVRSTDSPKSGCARWPPMWSPPPRRSATGWATSTDRSWRGHFVSFACSQSWNSPM